MLFFACTPAFAAQPIGRLTGVQGSIERNRTGTWEAAAANAPVLNGDRLRTGADGHLRLELVPDSVLSLGPQTEIVIARHKFDAAAWSDTLITLVSGHLHASAHSAYEAKNAEFRIVSPTAQVRVLGGEVIVEYSDLRGVTDVFALRGNANVRGVLDPSAAPVPITAAQAVRVKQGASPDAAYSTAWLLSDLLWEEKKVEPSVGSLFAGAMWPSNPVLLGTAPIESMDGSPADEADVPAGDPIRSSADQRNDVAAVLGQPPAVLIGPGRVQVDLPGN